MTSRSLAVAGQFYPNDKNELVRYINHFNQAIEESEFNLNFDFIPRAIISPHAGYIYSGFTANVAFKSIKNKINPKRIIVIGPSHKFAFDGASVSLYDEFQTPLGSLDIDLEFARELEKKYDFLDFIDEVHQEHSTETQMPFIKYYFSDVKIVEIVYSKCDFNNITQVIDEVLKDENNFVVISTDLSHFYNLNEAQKKDNICLDAIENLNIKKFDEGCEACGITGVKALVNYSAKHNFKTKLCDYRTSGDVSGDKTKVVGYTSFILGV